MNRAATSRAVFLDRDGTITEDPSFVGTVEQATVIPGAVAALKELQDAGYRLFVVTNQSGVGRGYFSRDAVEAIHAQLNNYLAAAGARFDRYYVCPHRPEDNCDCRKPKPKFLLEAAREFGLDLPHCYMVGDRLTDVQVGINAGTRTILVLTGAGRDTQAAGEIDPDFVADDIRAASAWILKNER